MNKSSPYANSQGKVYQHHYVMCESIGRPLLPDECVHHIDRDRTNNKLGNLLLLTHSEHGKLHALEDRGFSTEPRTCMNCKSLFVVSAISKQVFCSLPCSVLGRQKFEVSAPDLEVLVWSMPTSRVARLIGVSDVAVAKRCKKLGIKKPPRGYWAKFAAGKI